MWQPGLLYHFFLNDITDCQNWQSDLKMTTQFLMITLDRTCRIVAYNSDTQSARAITHLYQVPVNGIVDDTFVPLHSVLCQ